LVNITNAGRFSVGFFGKRNSNEKALDDLKHRRGLLELQLNAASQKLAEAVEARRKTLLESDLEQNGGAPIKNIIPRLRDEATALAEAVATLDAQIVEAENKLAIERERIKREQERDLRQSQLDAARKACDRFKEVAAELVALLKPLASIGYDCAHARNVTEFLAGQLALAHEAAFGEASRYVAQVASGHTPIKTEPVVIAPPPPPLPPIERQVVFLRVAGRWMERDETRTSGPHTSPDLPVEVAKLALRHGHAVESGSRVAADLRGLQDPDYAYWPPDRCVDLTRPMPVPIPQLPDQRAMQPPVHSGFVGQAQIGTANAVPIR
jgi:hypothetical protein